MKLLFRFLLFLVSFFLLSTTVVSAASYVIDSRGQLAGADGVVVNSETYSVRFIDTSVNDIWHLNTANPLDFAFNTFDEAQAASTALLEQVFSAKDKYNIRPELTSGIKYDRFGNIVTVYQAITSPFRISFDATKSINNYKTVLDYTGKLHFSEEAPSDLDFSENIYSVFAKWEKTTVSPVPEPSTMILLGTGIVGFIGSRRKKNKSA